MITQTDRKPRENFEFLSPLITFAMCQEGVTKSGVKVSDARATRIIVLAA